MKKASKTGAKNDLSTPVDALAGSDSGRLAQLVRDGLVRPARRAVPRGLIATPPPAPKRGASGTRALLDERRLVDPPAATSD